MTVEEARRAIKKMKVLTLHIEGVKQMSDELCFLSEVERYLDAYCGVLDMAIDKAEIKF